MSTIDSLVRQMRGRYRFATFVVLVLFGGLSLAFLWHASTPSPVNLLYLYDDAHALNQDRVVEAANGVGYNIDLCTTKTVSTTEAALVAFCRARATLSPVGTVVIVIDAHNGHLAIQDNGRVTENPVSFKSSQYQAAQRTFQRILAAREDFTGATVALLQELARAASTNRDANSLPWRGAMLLDFALVAAANVYLFFPDKQRQSELVCRRTRHLTLIK